MKKVKQKWKVTAILFLMLSLLSNQHIFGQFIPKILQESNEEIRSKTKKVESAGWLYFKESSQVKSGELFTNLKGATGLGISDSMLRTKEWDDEYGWSHTLYEQYHQGLKVEGASFSEHSKNCIVKIAHGKLIENLEIDTQNTISENQALSFAMQAVGATEYAWENDSWEESIQEEMEDPSASFLPVGELIIGHVLGKEYINENYQLVWKFQLKAIQPASLNDVTVDAHSGEVLKIKESGENNGPANTLYNGTRTIDTKKKLWYHILKTDDNSRKIVTKLGSSNSGVGWWRRQHVTDGDDDWGNDDQLATSAHWAVSESWDYFKSVHGRNGYNGDGKKVRVWAGSNLVNNARRFRVLKREFLEFGTWIASGNNLCALDIAGHEFTHGMTASLSSLGGENESGALNESFSDIFGVLIERNTTGNNSWIVGEDAIPGGLRSLANPGSIVAPAMGTPADGVDFRPALGLPDTWMGPRWYAGAFDDGGEHINCGVQNRWFNLLSTGGIHNGVPINGIGTNNAARITYYSLSTFIQEGSVYADAAQGAINAARIIFGNCSDEHIQTTNSWSACGVGNLFAGPCLDISGPAVVCLDLYHHTAEFNALDLPGAVFFWQFPDHWLGVTSGPGNSTLTVLDFGPPPPYVPYGLDVSVTSSNGGTETMEVILDECKTPKDPCGGNGFKVSPNTSFPITEQQLTGFEKSSSLGESQSSLTLFPNPASNFVSFRLSNRVLDLTIEVFDGNGKLINNFVSTLDKDKHNIDISTLPRGIYFVKIITDDFSVTKSFVKVK
ncbi:MAG TPA: T9SS type A sorting domain-containing protein [Bacteroidetes bacterium]|nr:T9SS type A sorting domain-containing protein [Bacteroidota bacterium]